MSHEQAQATMAQFSRIMDELAESRADRLFMGTICDHSEAGHFCCTLIWGVPGGAVCTDSLEAETAGRLRLHRWTLLGLITEVTDSAVEFVFYDDPPTMMAEAIALWPHLPALIRQEAEEGEMNRRRTHDVMGHA